MTKPISFSEAASALLTHDYVFAKTMPDNPHHYTLRAKWRDHDLFEAVVQYIRDYGYREKFKNSWYTLFKLNGHKYWTMGAALDKTILINRKALTAEYDDVSPYNGIAEAYDTLFDNDASFQQERLLINSLVINPRQPVLDIGCGTGMLLRHFGIATHLYTGIDISSDMLKQFRSRHHFYSNRIHLSSFEDWYGRGYGTITALFGTASYLNPEIVQQRIPNMLAPGGTAYLMYYGRDYTPITYTELGIAPNPIKVDHGAGAVFGNYVIMTITRPV